MRRYGMVMSPVSLTAGGIFLYFLIKSPWHLVLSILSFFWIIIELYIARKQEYLQQVPAASWIMISRVLWLFALAFILWAAASGFKEEIIPPIIRLPASLIYLSAIILRIKAFKDLGSSFTYDIRSESVSGIVSSGVYSMIRHPAYLAVCFLGTMPALIAGSLAGFILLFIFTVPQTLYRLEVEERMLKEVHGKNYQKYCESTWKMIPMIY